jgi:hypothetical protein
MLWSALSVIGVLWAIIPTANIAAAFISSFIVLIGMYAWHTQGQRLYRRFDYPKEVGVMDFNDPRPGATSNDRQALEYKIRDAPTSSSSTTSSKDGTIAAPLLQSSAKKSKFSVPDMLSRLLLGSESQSTTTAATATAAASSSAKTISEERLPEYRGYVTIKLLNSSSIFSTSPWTRCYLSMTGSALNYYIDQTTCENHAFQLLHRREQLTAEPMNPRPILLQGLLLSLSDQQEPPYELSLITSSESSADRGSSDGLLVVSGGNEEDERAVLQLRCDTIRETTAWIESLQRGISYANRSAATR